MSTVNSRARLAWRLTMAGAAYRGLLWLAPRDIRREHGRDMLETFDGMSATAASSGWWPVARLLACEFRDLAAVRRSALAASFIRAFHGSTHMFHALRRIVMVQEWRQSVRSLVRRPAFAATAILTLALGAGATTALFSIVDTVLIKPLPFPSADRLVTVYEASPSHREKASLIAPVRLDDWNRMNQTFAGIAGLYSENVTDTSSNAPERLEGRRVTPRYFDVFGAAPLLGRTFNADEERFGGTGAVVVSENWWTRHGRSAGVLSRSLRIGDKPYAIVGVMPRTFSSAAIDVWLPAQFAPQMMQIREARFLSGVGRIKPNVSLEQAHADLDRVQAQLGATFPKSDKNWSTMIQGLKDARIGDHGTALWLLLGAVALLWLIAVANVASLVLVHVRRRQHELAIRLAIGASRARVIGLILREVLIVSGIGGAIGIALAAWVVKIAPAAFPALPRLNELSLDWRAVACAIASSVIAALGAGLVPALQATRRRAATGLAQNSRGVVGDAHRMQKALVTAQVALSVLLCSSAALLVRSYYNLTHVNSGFSADGVVTFHVGARWDEDRARVGQLQQELITQLSGMHGVEAAGFANFLPESGATLRYQVKVDGLAGTDSNGLMTVGTRTISASYLRALRVPLVAGAWCPPLKYDFDAPQMTLVNRAFVDRFGGGQNLIGRQLRFSTADAGGAQTIVGVVADVAEDGVGVDPVPYVYSCASAGAWPDPEYVVRAADAGSVMTAVRSIVHRLDPSRAVFGVRALADVMAQSVDEPRIDAGVISAFAAAALLMAAIGLYGLFMLLVSESRREIGVRLALGATPHQMVQLVFAGAGRLLLIGIVVGLLLTVGAERLWRALLFGVSPLDVTTLLGATVTLAVVAGAAIAVPALRASRVAPTEALRD